MEVIEYELSLNDKVTNGLAKIQIINDEQLATWAKVQRQVNAADEAMQKCGVSVASLDKRVKAVKAVRDIIPAENITALKSANREIKRLENQAKKLKSLGVSKTSAPKGKEKEKIGLEAEPQKRQVAQKRQETPAPEGQGTFGSAENGMETVNSGLEKSKKAALTVSSALTGAASKLGDFFSAAAGSGQEPWAKLAEFKGKYDDIQNQLFTAAAPVVSVVIEQLTPALDKVGVLVGYVAGLFAKWAEKLREGQPLIVLITGLIAGFVMTLMAYKAVVGIINIITSVWTTLQAALNLVMSLNPVMLIVLAVLALIAVIATCIAYYDKFGAAMLFLMGPIGFIVNAFMALKNNWDSIVEAFQTDGILGGLKRIGVVILDAVLYPVQQLLEMLSVIPGVGDLAGEGAKKIADMRAGFDLVTPESKKEVAEGETGDAEGETAVAGFSGLMGGLPAFLKNNKAIPQREVKTDQSINNVASGGTRNTQITINLDKMVESMVFNGGFAENRNEVSRQVEETLVRLLYTAQSAV